MERLSHIVTLAPPSGSTVSMPQQYVDWLGDTSVAQVTRGQMVGDEAITIEVRDGGFLWHWAGKTLRISLTHLYGAKVTTRSQDGNRFLGLAFNFGKTPESGGVFLVTAAPEHEPWFREFALQLENAVPGGVQWSVT